MTFKCSRCGSEQHCDGALESPVYGMVLHVGNVQFIPSEDPRPFVTLERKGVRVSATMCGECGLVELTGDAEKLRRLEGA